jgi:hypothetical protein
LEELFPTEFYNHTNRKQISGAMIGSSNGEKQYFPLKRELIWEPLDYHSTFSDKKEPTAFAE